jgi:hypothetical protein
MKLKKLILESLIFVLNITYFDKVKYFKSTFNYLIKIFFLVKRTL